MKNSLGIIGKIAYSSLFRAKSAPFNDETSAEERRKTLINPSQSVQMSVQFLPENPHFPIQITIKGVNHSPKQRM